MTDEERTPLISRSMDTSTDDEANKLTFLATVITVLSVNIGTTTLGMPYSVAQMGQWVWLVTVFVIQAVVIYCSWLLQQSTMTMIKENKNSERLRDPYPMLAQVAWGKGLRYFLMASYILALTGWNIGPMLASSEVLTLNIPIPHIAQKFQVYIWMFIISSVIAPLSLPAYIKDNLGTAVVSFTSTFLAWTTIMVGCYFLDHPVRTEAPVTQPTFRTFISSVGYILSGTAGITSLTPNMIFEVKRPRRYIPATMLGGAIILTLVTIIGLVPFQIYQGHVYQDILSNFKESTHNKTLLTGLSTACGFVLCFHSIALVVITMNPVFQMIEETFKVPKGR